MSSVPATLTAAAIALAICGCAPPGEHGAEAPGALAPAADRSPDRMLRLVLRLTADGVETIAVVEASGRVGRRDPHRASSVFLRGLDRDGQTLFEQGVAIETRRRAEVHGQDGVIEGRSIPIEEPVFSVAVPLHPELDAIRFFRAEPGAARGSAALIGEVRP